MIYECTDCKHCANFEDGFRVFCLHPDLPSDEVCKYHPVGNGDASRCSGFMEGYESGLNFSFDQFTEAEAYCEANFEDVDYPGIRDWVEQERKKRG